MNLLTKIKNHQPPAFYTLFIVEMWERFGYYGLQSLLVLYVSTKFGFSDNKTYAIFAAFAALIYATPVLGGYLSDRVIGYQRTLILGAISLAIGYSILAFSNEIALYIGLGTVIAGNGLFKASPSSLLGKVYGPTDPRLEGGFTLYYMSINIGSFASILLVGYIEKDTGWPAAFSICSLGLIIGLITFLCTRRFVKQYGSEADFKPVSFFKLASILLIVGVSVLIFAGLLDHLVFTYTLISILGVFIVIFYGYLTTRLRGEERDKFLACMIMIIFAVAFFSLYFQAPTSLNLFVERNVNHHILGIYLPTSSFQAFNPIWILTLSPILAWLYGKLKAKKHDLSIPFKFAIGIILMGLGFLILSQTPHFANQNYHVSPWWIVASYFLQSLAELLVSALGVAMVAKLAPPRMLGMMMGTWFFSAAAAAALSGRLADLASVSGANRLDPSVSLPIYAHTFAIFGWLAISVGVIAFFFVPYLTRLAGDKII